MSIVERDDTIYMCKVYSDSYNLTSGAITPVTMANITYDKFGMFDKVNNKVTIKEAGLYIVVGSFSVTTSSIGRRNVYININNNTSSNSNGGSTYNFETITNSPTETFCSELQYLYPGDYVRLRTYQNSGSTLACVATLTVQRIDPNLEFCIVRRNATQSLLAATPTKFLMDTYPYDTWKMFDQTNNRINIKQKGTYLFAARAYNLNATLMKKIMFYKNGSPYDVMAVNTDGTASFDDNLNIVALMDLVAGDYIECWGYSDGAVNYAGYAGSANYFIIRMTCIKMDVSKKRYATLSRITTQNIPDVTLTKILLNYKEVDYWGMDDTTNNRIVINEEGLYGINAHAYYASSTGVKYIYVYKNGVAFLKSIYHLDSAVAADGNVETDGIAWLEAGDYLEMYVYHANGSAINYGGGTRPTAIQLHVWKF